MSRSVPSSVNAIAHVSVASLPFLPPFKTHPPAPLIHLSKIHPATFIKFRPIKVDGGGYLRYLGSRSQIKLADPSSLSFERSSRESPDGGDPSGAREAVTKIGRVFHEPLGPVVSIFHRGCQAHARSRFTPFPFSEIYLPPARTDLGCIMHPADKHLGQPATFILPRSSFERKKERKEKTIFTRVSLYSGN